MMATSYHSIVAVVVIVVAAVVVVVAVVVVDVVEIAVAVVVAVVVVVVAGLSHSTKPLHLLQNHSSLPKKMCNRFSLPSPSPSSSMFKPASKKAKQLINNFRFFFLFF